MQCRRLVKFEKWLPESRGNVVVEWPGCSRERVGDTGSTIERRERERGGGGEGEEEAGRRNGIPVVIVLALVAIVAASSRG